MIKRVVVYLSMFFVMQFVANGLVMAGNLIINGKEAEMGTVQLLIGQILFGILCIVVFLALRWTPVSPHYLSTRPFLVVVWCVIASVGTIVPSLCLEQYLDFLPDVSGEMLLDFIQHRWGYLAVGILAPLSEEIVFRGAVLRSLLESKTMGRWWAITVSSLLFAVAHLNPAQMPHVFLMGLLLGWLYERSRSLIPCTILHCANNTMAYLLAAAYPAPDITLRQIVGGSAQAEWMAVGFSLLILIPALFQLSQQLKR